MSLVPLILAGLVLLPIAAFFLQYVCFVCDQEQPSLRRAAAYVLATTACAYFVMDLSGYGLAVGMLDAGTAIPPYTQWFMLAPALKWEILGRVPLIRYLPLAFGLAAAGTLQVILLQVTFRVGVLIFLIQWVVNLMLLGAIAWGFGVLERSLGIDFFAVAEQKIEFGQYKLRDAPALNRLAERIQQVRGHMEPYLEPFKREMEPFTTQLPIPVQEFLNDGGWWLVLAVLALVAVIWARITWTRLRGALHQRKQVKKATRRALRENLNEIGPGVTEEGPRMVTVKGLPARLRLIVLAPAGQDLADLDEAGAQEVLECLRPGLGEVAGYDFPKVRVWSDAQSGFAFPSTFFQHVPIPKSKLNNSRWVLLAGSVTAHGQRIHVGLALHAEERNTLGTIKVGKNGWMDVLGIREPVQRKRVREDDFAPLR